MQDRYAQTNKVALLGITTNIILLSAKLLIGFISKSQAMIADGLNSAGDVFSSTMTFVGNRISSKPGDEDHRYGHGKAEYIFSMIIALSLLLVGMSTCWSSVASIFNQSTFEFSIWLVIVAIFTIAVKLSLFLYTSKIGKEFDNLLVIANSEDHRNDVIVTFGTLLSIILGLFGIYWVDGLVGTIISIWIGYTGIKIFRASYTTLMDTGLSDDLRSEFERLVNEVEGVAHLDDLIAKPIGVKYVVIVKISVNGDMTVRHSHQIARYIKYAINSNPHIADTVVHVNPAGEHGLQ